MRILAVAGIAAAAALAGCGSNEVVRGPVDATIGQQLIDLKQAHTRGALTDREYAQQRERLIEAALRGN